MSETRIVSVSGLRGVVGNGLDPSVVANFVAAYVAGLGEGPLVVGHDGRVSAHAYLPIVASSIMAMGRDVLQAGAVATPTLGRLVVDRGAAGGIQLSASHNPAEYNGLKFFQPGGMVLGPADGRAMVGRWNSLDFQWARWDRLGTLAAISDPLGGHLDRIISLVDADRIRSRKFVVAIDSCHGSGGKLGRVLLERLGVEVLAVGGDPDGLYDHVPEPTEKNLQGFSDLCLRHKVDVGFAQDPDADRLAIIDETGRYIGEELTLALSALQRLGKQPGPIVLNLSTSLVTEAVARQFGSPTYRTPVGEIHVVEEMLRQDAVLGGEGNGGVIDPRVGFVRDSFAAMAHVLDLLASSDRVLSSIVNALPRFSMVKKSYPKPSADVDQLFGRLSGLVPGGTMDRRDGLRLAWQDRWVHVRVSNTEPIVRVIAEAPDPAEADELANLFGRALTEEKSS